MMNLQIMTVAVWLSLLMGFGIDVNVVQAQSGNLEPPATAVDGGGNPVATTQTQPSWDQFLLTSERFKLVMFGLAVLDKATGLVWQRSPDSIERRWVNDLDPPDARRHCLNLDIASVRGWRLPSIHELMTLSTSALPEPSDEPRLPIGHPFQNVGATGYWSMTITVDNPTTAWLGNFALGVTGRHTTGFTARAWCVRGGGVLSSY